MLTIRNIYAITLLTISFCISSCSECELDSTESKKLNSILLEIDEAENSYVDEIGNHFYSGAFNSIQDTLLFKVSLKSGCKYQIYYTGPEPVYDVDMYLLNSNLDTISKALFYPPYLTEMFFTPAATDIYYIGLKLSDSYNQDLRFKLYFEKCEDENYSFCDKNWEGSGHWENLNEQTIKYNCSASRNIKWLRLIQAIKPNSKISFTVRTETSFIPSVGFAFAGTLELTKQGVFQEKLPQQGSYFNFNDTTSFRMVYNRYDNPGSYIYAFLNTKNINPIEGIKFEIVRADNSNHKVYINNEPSNYVLATYNYSQFYLVIEDIGESDVFFENFRIEEI